MKKQILRAAAICGGESELARRVGISRQAVNLWVKKGRIPAERVPAVVQATHGIIKHHELRPDIYPTPDKAA